VTQPLRERGGSSVDRTARPSSARQGLAELKVNAVFRESLNGDLTLPRVCRQKAVQLSSRSVAARSTARRSALNSQATPQASADSSKQTVLAFTVVRRTTVLTPACPCTDCYCG
jgi:hypothetical protein